jgi:transcriptional regulator with XRE-family HTH domain
MSNEKSIGLPAELQSTLAEIRQSIERRGLSTSQLASVVGISPSYLQSCLSGRRRLAPSRLVAACRELGIQFASVAAVLDRMVGENTYLRVSRAAQPYTCFYCGSTIRRNDEYVRLEPFGTPVQHFCRSCSVSARWLQSSHSLREDQNRSSDARNHILVHRHQPPPPNNSTATDDRQLLLPFSQHVKPTCVQLVDISRALSAKILANPAELCNLTPVQFEDFVLDRFSAMGLHAQPVGGGTYRRDGGIDIIFTPPKTFPFPFIGAVQVKHRRDFSSKLGPQPLRELMGVMAAHPFFAAGMIVTNTSFTPDAREFASHAQSMLRLRDFHDLMRWVADNFTDDAEWRELPRRIQLCDGVFVEL